MMFSISSLTSLLFLTSAVSMYISSIQAFVITNTHHSNNYNGRYLSSSSLTSSSTSTLSRQGITFTALHHNNLNANDNDNEQTYTIHISHENQNTTLTVNESETILSALERAKANANAAGATASTSTSTSTNSDSDSDSTNSDYNSFFSSLPTLPQECRKGNCLTCAASHIHHSNKKSVKTVDDGLTPIVKDAVDKEGYVQTCSSFVTGEDVWLELGVCHDVWDMVNGDNLEKERIRYEAMAKSMRMFDEKNVMKWAKKTETMLKEER